MRDGQIACVCTQLYTYQTQPWRRNVNPITANGAVYCHGTSHYLVDF